MMVFCLWEMRLECARMMSVGVGACHSASQVCIVVHSLHFRRTIVLYFFFLLLYEHYFFYVKNYLYARERLKTAVDHWLSNPPQSSVVRKVQHYIWKKNILFCLTQLNKGRRCAKSALGWAGYASIAAFYSRGCTTSHYNLISLLQKRSGNLYMWS